MAIRRINEDGTVEVLRPDSAQLSTIQGENAKFLQENPQVAQMVDLTTASCGQSIATLVNEVN